MAATWFASKFASTYVRNVGLTSSGGRMSRMRSHRQWLITPYCERSPGSGNRSVELSSPVSALNQPAVYSQTARFYHVLSEKK